MRGMMRRPVCLIGLAFVILIRIGLYFHPLSGPDLTEIDRSIVVLSGQVDRKEYHISNDQEVLVIYLKNVRVTNPQTENNKTDVTKQKQRTEDPYAAIRGVICYPEEGQEPRMGSYVRVRGKLYAFAEATNPGEFDAKRYYQILNLQAGIRNAVILHETNDYDRFREGLYALRTYLSSPLDQSLDEKNASVMKAVLLGEKGGLHEETKQLYQQNGIIHILSISGLHISIIGMGFSRLLRKGGCPKIANVILSVILMYGYGMMTGMSISARRAVMMFAFHAAAGVFGRTYDMLTAMSIAAVSALICQPLYLFHSGFLFSFGAIWAIGLLLPVMEENLLAKGAGKSGMICRMEKRTAAGLAVSVVTFPVYLCFYYEYPLYSLFLNMLLIPCTGLLVTDGLASLMAAACYLPLGKYAALPARLLLAFYELCCTAVLHLPESRSIPGRPENWQIAIFAALLCIAVLGNRRWTGLLFWQWLLLAVFCLTMRWQSGLRITALDVGQGDCIYLADEKGGRYLIDGGSLSKSDVGTYQILPFLKQEGVDTLNAVFVTHMDSDHYNGIYRLVEEMRSNGVGIENLILPDLGKRGRSKEYEELEALALGRGINVLRIHRGDTLGHGNLRLTCLHPEEGTEQTGNEASVVLYLEYGAFSALFTGDLEGNGEEAVGRQLKELLPDGGGITLLKAAHHGSENSTGEAFLKAVSPQIVLISAGRNNPYGHPHRELLDRLKTAECHVFRTDEGGALTVTVSADGRKLRVRAFLGK